MINEDIDTNPFKGNGWIAFLDAEARSKADLTKYPNLFTDAHLTKVDAVEALVKAFFSKNNRIYVTHRGNNGKGSFSVVKVDSALFPNWLKPEAKQAFQDAMDQLGVAAARNHPKTNAISYKIMC